MPQRKQLVMRDHSRVPGSCFCVEVWSEAKTPQEWLAMWKNLEWWAKQNQPLLEQQIKRSEAINYQI